MSSKVYGSSSHSGKSTILPIGASSSNSPNGSQSSRHHGDGLNFQSYFDLTAFLDKIGAVLDSGVVADYFDHRQFVRSGVAGTVVFAGHGIADDLIPMAAVKSVDDGRQNGFVEGKPQQHAANVFHIRHVLGEPRRTVCRRQGVLEGELPRSRLETRNPVR